MSGEGSPRSGADGAGLRLAVVAASWHERVMIGLIGGAQRAADQAGAHVDIFRVPGSFELPVACQRAAGAGYDAVVALGVIIRGGTPHFDYVCAGVTQGLTRVSLDSRVPVGFGVLTCDTEMQALDRAGLFSSNEDKGAEVVEAVLGTLAALAQIDSAREPYVGFAPTGDER